MAENYSYNLPLSAQVDHQFKLQFLQHLNDSFQHPTVTCYDFPTNENTDAIRRGALIQIFCDLNSRRKYLISFLYKLIYILFYYL